MRGARTAVLGLGLLGYGLPVAQPLDENAPMVLALRPGYGGCGAAQFEEKKFRGQRDAQRYASPTRLWPHDCETFAAR